MIYVSKKAAKVNVTGKDEAFSDDVGRFSYLNIRAPAKSPLNVRASGGNTEQESKRRRTLKRESRVAGRR